MKTPEELTIDELKSVAGGAFENNSISFPDNSISNNSYIDGGIINNIDGGIIFNGSLGGICGENDR